MSLIPYRGYMIDIMQTPSDYKFVIKKDEKVIHESVQGYHFFEDAEVQARLFINKLEKSRDGWLIS